MLFTLEFSSNKNIMERFRLLGLNLPSKRNYLFYKRSYVQE